MHSSLEKNYKKLFTGYDALLQKCSELTFEELNTPISEHKWSIAQVLAHINLSINNSVIYLNKKLQKPEMIPNSNWSTKFRSLLLNWALKSDIKFKAPKGIDIVPEKISFDEIRSEWIKQNRNLVTILDSIPESLLKKAVFRHPAVGRITLNNMLEFTHFHIDHHQKQINRQLSAIK